MLSVIVSIYNTKEYLPECLDSILAQTYQDLEIILIDDGSTDGSEAICEEYALKSEKVKVYHQKNQGLVASRKRGVELATGEYVAFVDSDDWIDSDFYETLVSYVGEEKADIVTSGIIYEWSDCSKQVTDVFVAGVYLKKEIQEQIYPGMAYHKEYDCQGITSAAWNKLFKREVIRATINKIDSQITYNEDGALLYTLLTKIDVLKVTHYCGYHYRQRDNSMIHTFSEKSFDKALALSRCMKREILDKNDSACLKEQVNQYTGAVWKHIIKETCGTILDTGFFLFPYHLIPKNSRLVLYGAGEVGRTYYHCVEDGKYAALVAWVDKQYKIYDNRVEAPETITKKEFDYVVIAVNKEEVAKEIARYLESLGVAKCKIVWERPRRITNV